jgi:ParB family chromosome partitioning protein
MSSKTRSSIRVPAFQPHKPVVSAEQAQKTAEAIPWPHGVTHAPATQDAEAPAPSAVSPAKVGARQLSPGELVDVPLERIRSNPRNPRVLYPAESIDTMAQSLLKHGQQTPAIGYVEDDLVVLIAGETRLRGARAAGLSTLCVHLRPKPQTLRELYELSRVENCDRNNQTVLDDAVRWTELLADGTYPSATELAIALGIDKGHVSRVLSLAQLPQKLMLLITPYPDLVTMRALNAIREYWEAAGDERQVIDLIHEAGKEGWGYRQIQARRESLTAQKPGSRPRATRHPLQHLGTRGEIKAFAKTGRVEISLKGLAPEQIDHLAETLVAQVKGYLLEHVSAIEAAPAGTATSTATPTG